MANIAAALCALATAQPHALAVAWPVGLRRGRVCYARMSYAELDVASDALARGLLAAGLAAGERVALLVPPSREFFATVFAILKAGLVLVAIDPGLGLRRMGGCLREADAAAFIGIPKAHLARALFRWPRARLRLVAGGRWLGLRSVTELEAVGRGRSGTLCATTADDPAAILFTSGSTGAPKGACYTHGNFLAQVAALQELFGIAPGEVDCATFPLFALFAPALGMAAVVPRMDFTRPARVHAPHLLHCLEEFGVTNAFGSPALWDRVARHCERTGERLPATLRRLTSAGAPVPPAVLRRLGPALPPGVQVFTPYGATECLPVTCIGSEEILGTTAATHAAGQGLCVGRAAPGVELAIIPILDAAIPAWDESLRQRPGVMGEIAVRAAQATASYWQRPEATARAKIADPRGGVWHRMGDLGHLDGEGRLWFHGRVVHAVRCAEGLLGSVTCEGVFEAHPAVRRSALIRIIVQGQARPALCLELEPDAEWNLELRDELLALGQGNPLTRPIRHFFHPPAFPVDIRHNAKIDREALGVWAQRRMDAGT